MSKRVTAGNSSVAIGYIRYSTAKQGDNSVERQREAIERWATRMGCAIAGWAEDLEVSRTVAHGARPGLMAALADLKAGQYGVLVAESVSRFAGDNYILEALRRELPKGARLTTTDETGNADLDEDKQEFDAMFSRREIKQIRSRTKGGLAVKRMRGECVGTVGYGFRRKADGQHVTRKDDGSRKCAPNCLGCLHVEENPGEAEVVRLARVLAEGRSLRAVAGALTLAGHVSRSGKPFFAPQVARMLGKSAA